MTLAEKVDRILEKIPCVKLNNVEYIQYPKSLIDHLEYKFVKLIDEELGTSFIDKGFSRQGIIGRWVDDSGKSDLYRGWNFFMTIDDNYRKWEQMYYTFPANYEKHKHEAVCINKTNPELIRLFRARNLDLLLD